MPCFHPIKGHYASSINSDTRKRSVVFSGSDVLYDRPVSVPCGRCIGCRLERSRQWAVRCVHEASLYDSNCFITLTFRESSPMPGHRDLTRSLHKADFQLFMKRLRKRFGSGIRYFHCGEYGEQLRRPHHHACLFNFDFPDKYLFQEKEGVKLYRSEILESLWPYGYCTVGDVTFESAAYVARYVAKKVLGKLAKGHYGDLVPEYCTMSRRPGLGDGWFKKYASDLFPKDFVIIRGKRMKIPKFYLNKFKLTDAKECANVLANRVMVSRGSEHHIPERLEDSEVILKQRCEQLIRPLEVSNG